MSKENAKKLFEELQTREDLKAKVQSTADPADMVKIAADAGYDVTLEELVEVDRDFRRSQAAKTDETVKELSLDELEGVAGGLYWESEDAPDGHEMGCMVAYHHYGYQLENQVWCENAHWCVSKSIEVNESADSKKCGRLYANLGGN